MCICSPLTEHVWWSSTIFKVKLILKFYLTIRVHSINRELFPSHGSSNMLLFRHMRRPLVHATWHATCHLDSCNMGWEVLCVPSGWVGCLTLLNELCPELVSLVLLHTFSCLAQLCKKTMHFRCSSVLRKKWRTISSSQPLFYTYVWHYRCRDRTHNLPLQGF
jgi:hypothetical protein